MKRIIILLVMMAMLMGFSVQAHATLFNRGTDSLGNRLIYDDDLNITWYDYTKSSDIWQDQMDWADTLSVTFGSQTFDDWRLPSAVDGNCVYGFDGTTTCGHNITNSEMGHLFYTELGNLGYYDTSGNPQLGSGLTNTGDFQNLQSSGYWSGTEYSANPFHAWVSDFNGGNHVVRYEYDPYYYALAVRPGDVSTQVPEPATILLIGSGLVGMVVFRKRLGKIKI